MDPIDSNTRDLNQQFHQRPQEPVPNSTAVLVLGILSLVLCGLIGLVLGIIGLSMANKAKAVYEAEPSRYTEGSVSNLNGGRICSIIGIIVSSIAFIITLFYLV